MLSHDNREWYLEDLKSTHGTRHNGKPIGRGRQEAPARRRRRRDGPLQDHVPRARSSASPGLLASRRPRPSPARWSRRCSPQIGTDGHQMPYLRVMNGPEEGKKLDIGPDVAEATIGRGTDCDFQINDANVSRRHAHHSARLERDHHRGRRQQERRRRQRAPHHASRRALRDADEIMLGAMKLTFIDPSAKFLGKLDDIPAFQDQPTSAESERAWQHEDGGERGDGDEAPSDDDADRALAGRAPTRRRPSPPRAGTAPATTTIAPQPRPALRGAPAERSRTRCRSRARWAPPKSCSSCSPSSRSSALAVGVAILVRTDEQAHSGADSRPTPGPRRRRRRRSGRAGPRRRLRRLRGAREAPPGKTYALALGIVEERGRGRRGRAGHLPVGVPAPRHLPRRRPLLDVDLSGWRRTTR